MAIIKLSSLRPYNYRPAYNAFIFIAWVVVGGGSVYWPLYFSDSALFYVRKKVHRKNLQLCRNNLCVPFITMSVVKKERDSIVLYWTCCAP